MFHEYDYIYTLGQSDAMKRVAQCSTFYIIALINRLLEWKPILELNTRVIINTMGREHTSTSVSRTQTLSPSDTPPLVSLSSASGSRISVGGQKSGTSSAEFTIRPFRRLLCSSRNSSSPFPLHLHHPNYPFVILPPLLYNYKN